LPGRSRPTDRLFKDRKCMKIVVKYTAGWIGLVVLAIINGTIPFAAQIHPLPENG
jgi:hypothetical protein